MECQTKRCIRIIALLIVLGPIAAAQSNSIIVEQYSEEAQKALVAGKYDEAQHAYEKLRDLEPGIAEVHANLGLIYFHERLFEKAIASCRKALAIKPTLDATRALLAISLTELGRYSDGLPGLEKAFHDSTDSNIKRMCGLELMRAYDNLQRESDAVEVGIALNRAFPDDAEILYQTGRVYGNYAFVTMNRLSQVAPHSICRQIAAGEAAEGNGNFDQALIAYRACSRWIRTIPVSTIVSLEFLNLVHSKQFRPMTFKRPVRNLSRNCKSTLQTPMPHTKSG